MKTSTALRKTKARLWDGRGVKPDDKRGPICYAAEDAGVHGIVGPIIRRRLGKHALLRFWLMDKHGIDVSLDQQKYQQTRHAWLDHLIRQYEAKGD